MLQGIAHVYGDNIDTDRIIPGKYTKTLDISQLAAHVLEDLDPEFRDRVQNGDMIFAGDNFGTGSSREQAPVAIKASGISVVVARSFARIFFRNAINIGLPVIAVPDHDFEQGHIAQVDLKSGILTNETTGKQFTISKMPQVMIEILDAGGLVNYLKTHGTYNLKG